MGRMLFQDMLAKSKNCLNGLKKDISHNDLGLYKNDPHHIITYCFVLGDLCVLFPNFGLHHLSLVPGAGVQIHSLCLPPKK